VYGTPHTVAGEGIETDINKCQLRPLRRSDYVLPLTDAQWAQLESVFASGVCDFTKPGVDQQKTVPWLIYQESSGRAIVGGRPLGPPPQSQPFTGAGLLGATDHAGATPAATPNTSPRGVGVPVAAIWGLLFGLCGVQRFRRRVRATERITRRVA